MADQVFDFTNAPDVSELSEEEARVVLASRWNNVILQTRDQLLIANQEALRQGNMSLSWKLGVLFTWIGQDFNRPPAVRH